MSGKHRLRKRKRRRRGNPAAQLLADTRTMADVAPVTLTLTTPAVLAPRPIAAPAPSVNLAHVRSRFKQLAENSHGR